MQLAKKILIILTLIMPFITSSGQSDNPRSINPHAISFYAIGPNVVASVSYDYFVTPYFNAEAGIGFIGIHGGFKVHFGGWKDKRWTPYIGAAVAKSLFKSVGVDFMPYLPAGMQYVGKNHLNFAFEIAPFQLSMLSWNVVGIKLGYRF